MKTDEWRTFVVLWLVMLTVAGAVIAVKVFDMSSTQDVLWEQTVEASAKANVALDRIIEFQLEAREK